MVLHTNFPLETEENHENPQAEMSSLLTYILISEIWTPVEMSNHSTVASTYGFERVHYILKKFRLWRKTNFEITK